MQSALIQEKSFPIHVSQTLVRYVVGLAIALVGLADMVSAMLPKLKWNILSSAWPIDIHERVNAQTLTVVVGFFLVMLSYGLARGKRQAWRITISLLLLSAFLHVLRVGSIMTILVALLLVLLLCGLMHFFQAKSDPPSVVRGYVTLALSLAIVIFYIIGGFLALYGDFEALIDRFGMDGLVLRLFIHMHVHLSRSSPAFFFSQAFPVLCTCAVLYGMVQLFRPVARTLLLDEEERLRVAELVHRYGTNSISYFALGMEKTHFFSEPGQVVISYVLKGSTAVVVGDPIGSEDEIRSAIEQFMTFCHEQDWSLVFWQVRDTYVKLYRSFGLGLLKIGEDAVINTSTFTLKGGAMANVRSSLKRAEKDGVRVVFYQGQVYDMEQLNQMECISRAWLVSKGDSEMGFSMGHFDPLGDPEQTTAVAVDADNKVHAFVTFVPIYGRCGFGLDLMRRAEHPAPGTMELLLARSIEYLKANGAEMISLGLAPLSDANEDDETFLGNSIDFLTHLFGNPEKNRSLFNFKKKFQPTWESRYLVYSGTLSLPKIGWALYHAHKSDATLLKALRSAIIEWQRSRQQNACKAMEAA